jgi:hypothetical protein
MAQTMAGDAIYDATPTMEVDNEAANDLAATPRVLHPSALLARWGSSLPSNLSRYRAVLTRARVPSFH